jgi:hypothetical protein
VWLPGDAEDAPSIAMSVPIPADVIRQQQAAVGLEFEDPDIGRMMRIHAPIMLQPFVIREPGHIKIRAFIDGEVTKIGALKIRAAEPFAPQPS